ncbi:MAG: DUF5817 domain-containing protein [Halobacteriales archaeon]
MYAVVGCSECTALWIVEDRPKTTGCPRCRTRHQFTRLKSFVETDDENEARNVRAALLAQRSGGDEAREALDSFEGMERRAEAAGVSDEEYLAGLGIDPETVADAGESSGGGGSSRRETVLEGLEHLDAPTEAEVVAYAADHGVPETYTRTALAKLVRAGEVSESGGRYRLL